MLRFLEKRGQNCFGDGYSYVIHSGKTNGIPVNYNKTIVKLIN